jgi:hypothetical protein
MKSIKMPEINHFRHIISNIKRQTQYIGKDENNNPIYDENIKLPIVKAIGTEKIHGTNGSVAFDNINGIRAQSKTSIITIEKDNAGFAFFVLKNKDIFLSLINKIIERENINKNENTIVIYGEWAGKGIQKNMAYNKLDKFFVIFGVKIKPFNEEINSYWVNEENLSSHDNRIYNINDFEKFEIEIDFNNPGEAQNKMVDMMLEVEKQSPLGKYFGVDGIGEGIVFKFKYNNVFHRFKVKGEKHAGKSKVKKLKKVDNEKLQKINDIAYKVCPQWRLEQMYNEVMDILNGGIGDKSKTGEFLKSLIKDIHKEELDIIIDAGLEPKDVNKAISQIGRKWLFNKLDEEAGLK